MSILSNSHQVCAKGKYCAIVSTTVETATPAKETAAGLELLEGKLTQFDNIVETFEPLADENPVLTAVPLAPARLRERGFNQALEIARSFGRVRGLRTDAAAIRRTRSGLPQAQLGPGSRRTNIAGAFEATPSRVAGRAIWVVDDVITTSATLHSVALALKHAGARSVTNLVIARTPMDHPNDHVQRRSRST